VPSNERQFVTGLMKAAKQGFRGAVVIKHADRFTRNIPDIQICWADRSWWIEAKHLRKGRRLKDIVEKGQLLFGHELATVSGGRAMIAVLNDVDARVEVWTPRALFLRLYPALAAGVEAVPLAFDPSGPTMNTNALRALCANGMLHWPLALSNSPADLPARVMHDGFAK